MYDAYHSRNLKGFYMGGRVPLGFHLEPCTLEGKRTSKYAVDPREADILRMMYAEYAKPHTSFADVVQMLQSKNISHPRNETGVWVRNHIGRLLRNPIYVRADRDVYDFFQHQNVCIFNPPADFAGICGCYLYKLSEGKGLVLAPHEGIVSSELWLACAKKSKVRRLYPSVN